LIHWKPDEATDRVKELEKAGYEVVLNSGQGNAILRKLRENPPDLVVIDLSRMPSQGRDIAVGIRMGKATRRVPIIFVEGEPEKVNRFKKLLPDATYSTWNSVLERLDQVIKNPPKDPVVPKSILAGYSGTPLTKKLGIKANSRVALVGAPVDFERTLGEVPESTRLIRGLGNESDLIICFVKSQKELLDTLERLKTSMAQKGGLWLAWPKKTSGIVSDLTQTDVRSLGLSNGLVDYKVCAIDATWSGLKFAKRR
jgi:CheY-like chemotaxis protein